MVGPTIWVAMVAITRRRPTIAIRRPVDTRATLLPRAIRRRRRRQPIQLMAMRVRERHLHQRRAAAIRVTMPIQVTLPPAMEAASVALMARAMMARAVREEISIENAHGIMTAGMHETTTGDLTPMVEGRALTEATVRHLVCHMALCSEAGACHYQNLLSFSSRASRWMQQPLVADLPKAFLAIRPRKRRCVASSTARLGALSLGLTALAAPALRLRAVLSVRHHDGLGPSLGREGGGHLPPGPDRRQAHRVHDLAGRAAPQPEEGPQPQPAAVATAL